MEEAVQELRSKVGEAEAGHYSRAGRLDYSWQGLARYWRKKGLWARRGSIMRITELRARWDGRPEIPLRILRSKSEATRLGGWDASSTADRLSRPRHRHVPTDSRADRHRGERAVVSGGRAHHILGQRLLSRRCGRILQSVRDGSQRGHKGIPLYTMKTREPFDVVYVPVGSGPAASRTNGGAMETLRAPSAIRRHPFRSIVTTSPPQWRRGSAGRRPAGAPPVRSDRRLQPRGRRRRASLRRQVRPRRRLSRSASRVH